ncbi:hypothetical protein STENM327S_07338 [Streptomyces tendae]
MRSGLLKWTTRAAKGLNIKPPTTAGAYAAHTRDEGSVAETEGAAVPERLLITRTTTGGGVSLVSLAGEVDLDGSSQLREVLLASVESAPGTVVDFGEVGFLDSSGINVLISVHRAAEARGVWFRLAAPRDPVERVLRLVGVDTLIPCYPSVAQALAA